MSGENIAALIFVDAGKRGKRACLGSLRVFVVTYDPSSKACMVALDSINREFGKGTLVYGTAGLKREWDMRCGYMSKAYSTNWDELLEV